jgi:hypothetical protein
MNLAMLLSGLTPQEICDRWRTVPVREFVSLAEISEYLKSPHWKAMGDAGGLRDKVYPHLGIDPDKIRQASGMTAVFNLCEFSRKVNCAIPHAEMDLDLLIAAVSLPALMPAVEKNGKIYTDSVWIKDANLTEAVKRGAEELWLVWCIGNTPCYHNGLFRQYVHMIEMSANGVLFEELDRIRELNEQIERGHSPYGQRQPVRLHVIKPEYAIPLDPDFFLGRIDAATLISLGYAAATHYLGGRQAEGVPLTPEATQMKEPTPGLTFRETMTGPMTAGATDPKKAPAEGPRLSMNVTVSIDDIEKFTTDPNHPGSLVGTIDYPPFGTGIPCPTGLFQLFSPRDGSKIRYMIYELGFKHGGKEYYLAGRKEVHDDSGLDLWSDTTTLYTVLHEGTDKSGPIVAAGVLSLGVTDLIRLLKTMHATNPTSAAAAAKAIAKFGRFFLGTLWETYGVHLKTE